MTDTPNIQPLAPIVPMVYAYTTPEIARHNGWTKIGYTEKKTPQERIKEQTHTADVEAKLEWADNAIYKDGSGEAFTDKDFHRYLRRYKHIEQEDDKDNEWFHIEPKPAKEYFDEFAARIITFDDGEHVEYDLRPEQEYAVKITADYFKNGGTEFLWNAKPRFGKTLTAYDLIQRLGYHKVLVVTNRPSIANSWADDFKKFVSWKKEYVFVSENDAISKNDVVVTRDEYLDIRHNNPDYDDAKMIAFESLQGLKGSVYFGGAFPKLEWIHSLEFDLLIVDESQEGVDTLRSDKLFEEINARHVLYLSGTPFKALADGRFETDQIYNWSYVDEQKAKENWDSESFNPYERLPELQMYTYQMSPMIEGRLAQGADISDEGFADFAFDLNEFFATNDSGKFIHDAEVDKFLDTLTKNEKYPFSTPELRDELPHTIWMLNRVASVKALAKKLRERPEFADYEIVEAVGQEYKDDDANVKTALDKVRKAIKEHGKTITLSVGQLTVGVTVPEWSAILMLSNMKSPSSYMQAAFRVQNPYTTTKVVDGKPVRVQKERGYVFDFDPARTLIVYEQFANNLNSSTSAGKGTQAEREENIKELLNFFPVIGEDQDGKMVEIDASAVLTIPRKIKSVEVVRHGFMSNYLFANIGNIFSAPTEVTEIIKQLIPTSDKDFDAQVNTLKNMGDIAVDEHGEVDILDEIVIGRSADMFGDKVYETVIADIDSVKDVMAGIDFESDTAEVQASIRRVKESLKDSIEHNVIDRAADEYGLKKSRQKQLVRESHNEIDLKAKRIEDDFIQQKRIAEFERDRKIREAESSAQIEEAKKDYSKAVKESVDNLTSAMQGLVESTGSSQPEELTRKVEEFKAIEEKSAVEDMVRAHLRGFARTIPSFLMAYGDRSLTIANIDNYTEDDVFAEVTGITEEQFRFLRDGGDYVDEETGETKHFEGHLFDEAVFNDSVQQFLDKKEELADYFDETHVEDIFDYIPPQKTNQIFTPRWVVKEMVDDLEVENPGCFDDAKNTFADLYMKSGLYITEIVKRLYNSDGIKAVYPDDAERIKHILSKQVYGIAPTRIIYLIAMSYIFGFDDEWLSIARNDRLPNFVESDAAEAAKDGKLPEVVDHLFSKNFACR